MESLPKDLMYIVSNVQNYSKNTVKLQTLNQSTLSSKGATQARLALPVNAIVNMKSLAMHCTMKTKGVAATGGNANAVYALIPKGGLNSVIDRATWSAGGVSLDNGVTPYHVVKNMKDNLELSSSRFLSDEQVLNNSVIEPISATNAASSDEGQTKELCLSNFLGFTGCAPTYLDLNRLPECFLTVQISDASVLPIQHQGKLLGEAQTATLNGNFSGTECSFDLENIYFTCEVISFGNGIYEALTDRVLAEKGSIDIPYHQFQTFTTESSSASASIRGSVSTGSLNRVYALQRDVGTAGKEYNKQTMPVATNGGNSTFAFIQTAHNFTGSGVGSYQFQVNNVPYPLYKPTRMEAFKFAVQGEGRTYDKCGGGLVSSQDMWKDNCWTASIKLNHDNELTRLSGLDLRATNAQISYSATANSDSAFNRQIMMLTEQTSVLRVGAGRVVAVIS